MPCRASDQRERNASLSYIHLCPMPCPVSLPLLSNLLCLCLNVIHELFRGHSFGLFMYPEPCIMYFSKSRIIGEILLNLLPKLVLVLHIYHLFIVVLLELLSLNLGNPVKYSPCLLLLSVNFPAAMLENRPVENVRPLLVPRSSHDPA